MKKFNMMTHTRKHISGPAQTLHVHQIDVGMGMNHKNEELRFDLGGGMCLTLFKIFEVLPELQGQIDLPGCEPLLFAIGYDDVDIHSRYVDYTARFTEAR